MNLKAQMKRRLATIGIGTLIVSVLGVQFMHQTQGSILGARVDAVGNVSFSYLDAPLSGPIFDVANMLPLDCETRSVSVTNGETSARDIWVRSANEVNPDGLAEVLTLVISEDGTDLYGGTTGAKTVADLFADSTGSSSVPLSNLPAGETTAYDFEVCMQNVGNEYQATVTQFDLVFGTNDGPVGEIPAECSHLAGKINNIIIGTDDDDRIAGTTKHDLILGLGGDDKITGTSGHDCIVGGPGNDRLNGNSGDDVIIGGEGDDDLYGNSGHDLIYAGPGNDKVRGNSGNNVIYGGPGDDEMRGSSGRDTIYGEEDDDEIRGGSGNDYLDGGSETDWIDGQNGTDTCLAAESVVRCEL